MLLSLIRHYAGGNKSKFARKLGINPQCLATWLSRNTFDIELLFAMCEHINPAWLFTGKGSMLLNADGSDLDLPNSVSSQEGIPLLRIDAMSGVLESELLKVKYSAQRFRIPVFRGADFLITVRGDSMSPTYKAGDLVVRKILSTVGWVIQWNRVYLIGTDQGVLLKRIKQSSTDTSIMLLSDNTSYDPFEMPLNKIHSVASVIGVIHPE